MQQTRKRRFLIAFCSLLFACIMGIAVAQVVPASAEELVLSGNTAKYTFENDAAFPWTWEKTTNTWTRHHSGSRDEMVQHSKLTLKVTSDGDVAFKYKVHSKNEGDYLKLSKNGEDLNTTQHTAAEYTEVKMDGLKTNDTLTFELYLSSYNGGFDYYVSIGGLDNASLLSQTYEVKATAEDGGTVAVGDETFQAEATKQVPFGESVVLKAKANDGKVFFGWKKGGEYVSTSEQLTVDVNAIMAAQEYTAEFVEPTYQKKTLSGWTEADGVYTPTLTKSSTSTMTFEFVDEKYIFFDLSFCYAGRASILGLEFTVQIDGKQAYSTGSDKTVTTTLSFSEVLHAEGNGRHVAIFTVKIGSMAPTTGSPSASLKNIAFKLPNQTAMQDVTLDWAEPLGDVWIVEGYKETSDLMIKANGHQVTGKTLNLPVGMTVSFYAFPKDGAKSTVTSGNTHGVFSGYYNGKDSLTDEQAYSGKVGTDVFSAGKTLEIRFLEYVPAPEIELTKTIGIEQERGISVQNGSVIDVPDGGNNNLVFQISKYKTQVEKLTATAGGEDVPITEENQTDQYFGLVLTNVTERSEVVITLDYGDGYYADPITIQLNITTPKGLQDVVFEGAQVTVENFDGEYFPWFYDAEMSTDGFTYTSGISYGASAIGRFPDPKDGGVWKEPFTYLKFTVTGSGSFSFDFYLDGGLYSGSPTSWAGYSLTTAPEYGYGNWTNKFQLAYGNNSDGTKEASHADAVIADDGDNGEATVTRIQDGQNWFSCSIPITASEQQTTTIYIIHQFKNSSQKTYYPLNQMSVRNVKFFSGSKKVEWGVKDGSGEDATGNGTITATVDGKTQTSGDQGGISAGSLIKFTAKPEAGKQLYAWVDGNGKVLSYEDEFTYPLAGEDTKIYAVIDDEDTFAARIGGRLYKTIDAAATAAQDGDKIILLKSTEAAASFEIKKGVSLILPIDGREAYYERGKYDSNHPESPDNTASPNISWAPGSKFATPVVTLTVAPDAAITVKGSLYVGGVLHCQDQSAQGHTSGKYTQLILNGSITIEEGGLMDVYGRVTGTGGITVKSGGILYQPFLILDYAGGQNTQDLFNLGQTPFKRYAMINIQCGKGYTINYGGELYGHASLYFLSSVTTLDTQFISYVGSVQVNGAEKKGTKTLINLKDGASATGVYKDEKFVTSDGGNTANIGHTTLTIRGGAEAGYMDFLGLVQTDGVAFSIPYNYDLVLTGNGTFDMSYDYKLMPGASLTVEKGSTLNLNAKFYVYDGLVQSKMSRKAYPTAAELTANKYYSTNANFIVNGTLNIGSSATFLGVIQTTDTTGTATITVEQGAILAGKIVDGGTTKYDCNYMEYESSARLYDKAHKTLASIPVDEDGKAQKAMTFTSTWQTEDATWGIDPIDLKYEKNDYGDADKMGTHNGHTAGANYEQGKTSAVTGLEGSWKVEHDKDNFDWSQLLEGENDFAGKKFKELTRQCTELGCDKKEHKLLLNASAITLSAVYKGAEFNQDEVLKIFCQAVFGSDSVPEEYSSYFSASANLTATLNNANKYEGKVEISLEGGLFDTVGTTEHTYDFTIAKFNVEKLDKSAIEKALTEKNFTYNGEAQKLDDKELEAVLKAEGLTGTVSHAAFVWANNTNAGTNTASVTITGSGTNFEGTLTVNFSIAKAKITIKVTDKEKDYDGQAYTDTESAGEGDYTVTVGQIYKPNGVADFTVKLTVQEAAKDAASYTVTAAAVGAGAENYEISYEQGTYTIHQKALTVTIGEVEQVYGGTLSALTFTLAGDVSGETESIKQAISLSTEAVAWSNVGTYKITATYKAGEGILKNYTVTVSNENNKAYSVTAKEIGEATFTVTPSYTYDGKEKQPVVSEITVTLDGYTNDHAVTFTVESYQDNTNAGTASLTVKGTNNFAGTKTVNFEIAKRSIEGATIEKINDVEYNGKAQQLKPSSVTVAIDGGTLTLRETTDYTVSWTADCTNVGTVTVTLKAAENGNYEGTATATYSINQKKLTITADDQTTPEGEAVLSGKALTWKVTDGQFYNQDETEIGTHIEVSTEADSKKAGTDFEIKIGWESEYSCKNYDVTFKNGTYHIVDAIFKNVAISGQTVKYNGEKHNLTVTIPNEDIQQIATIKITKDGEDFDGATDAGVYSLHVNITAQGYSTKYDLDVTLTIEKIAVTVTFDAKSSTYGDDVVTEFTYTMPAGVLEKDRETVKAAITPRTDATKKSGVDGSYKITADKPVLTNYDVTIEDGVYTIKARPVTVTVKKQTVTFNQAQQSASSTYETDWTVDNLAEGDEASVLKIKLTAAGKDAKAYDIAATYQNNNYTVTFKGEGDLAVEGSTVKEAFVIEAAALTEATLTSSHTYDGSEQTPTFTVKAGALTVAEGDFELAYDGADRVSAGTVQVTVKAKSGNYSGEVKTNFEIAKKQIKVTLTAQTAEYSGKVPTLNQKAYTVEDGGLCSRNGKEDDLQITIKLVNGQKDVGDYNLDAEAGNTDYEVTFDKSAKFKVTQKAITVKADDLTSVYGEKVKELTYTANGLVEGEDPKTELKITLQASSTIKEEGSYTITGSGSAKNYTFTVAGGTYTVSPKPIRVQIVSRSSEYDGKEPTVTSVRGTDWTVAEDAIEQGDDLQIVLTKASGVDVKQGGYAITGKYTNHNYTVTFVEGTYTITARPVTVKIADQEAVYDYAHKYAFNNDAWTYEGTLAGSETRADLKITLSTETLTDAGSYKITGTCANGNYAVTFTGSYTKQEDAASGHAGVYTVKQKDVGDGTEDVAVFLLVVGEGGNTSEGERKLRVKLTGESLSVTCTVKVYEGKAEKTLNCKIDPAELKTLGEQTVTVTIEDKNYKGSAVFTVVVTDAEGFTPELKAKLEQLKTLAEGMDAEALKAEDFQKLKEINTLLTALSEEEREALGESLEPYDELVAAWHELADLDEIIETAEAIGNAPIRGLYEAAAVVSALAVLGYIVMKGGLL